MDNVATVTGQRVTRLLQSSSVQAAVAFGLGGIGFALASLLLARVLEPADFGLLALLLALVQMGIAFGPAGVDLVVNRHRLPPTMRLAGRVSATSAVTGLGVCAIAAGVYAVPGPLLPWLLLAVIASSLSKVGATLFQSGERFHVSLVLSQSHNYLLLLAVPLFVAVDSVQVASFMAIIALGYVATVIAGWWGARATLPASRQAVSETVLLKEGVSGLGIGAAVLVMMQLERFIIPLLLSLEEMATFAVLAAVVGAPFRMMQLAVGFTMLPRLSGVASRSEARRLVRGEAAVAAAICLLGTAFVLGVGPWLIHTVAGDRYDVPLSLFVAMIAVGYVRIGQAIAVATVNALGESGALGVMNAACWVAMAVACAGAWALSDYGLVGLVYGVGTGWLLQAGFAAWLARRAFNHRFGAPPA